MTLDEFHYLVGQTVMFCQVIEHDVKLIYAAMRAGDFDKNLRFIEKWTLGQAVLELETLDRSGRRPYISASDYDYLKKITQKRNHWCHNGYQCFVYKKNWAQSKEYSDECRKLLDDNKRLSTVWSALEDIRVRAMRDFGRL